MTISKKIACLYRVSTKKQVEENDIPMQKNACNAFISTMPGWVLTYEYHEKGVSGYHKSAKQRDILQQARSDAENGLFDILLVFMFDRLGRREDETPFIVEWFITQGIEVWSVMEGQQRFDSRADKLINYIRFWQSGGESEKTSMRVKEKHKQMVENGQYRGGTPPYGYMLIESEITNQKGYKLKELAINKKESEVVKTIFKLVCENGYGGHRIAKYLNEREIKTKQGNFWTTDTVMSLLKNPIYKGYYVSGKRPSTRGGSKRVSPENWIYSNVQIPRLIIIAEQTWNNAKEIRESRNAKTNKYPRQTKGPLFFVGMAKCAICDSNLVSRYAVKKWTRKKDNQEIEYLQPKYICSWRRATTPCTGQRTFSQKKIDPTVMEEVYMYLASLQTMDLSSDINKMQDQIKKDTERDLQTINAKIAKTEKELKLLNNEIIKTLTNESSFTAVQLSSAITKKEEELEQSKQNKKRLIDELLCNKIETSTATRLHTMMPNWQQEFEGSEIEIKKMLLTKLIDTVFISRDSIDVHFTFNLFNIA